MPLRAIEAIVESPKLPSLPAVAVRIIELVKDPDVSMHRLVEVISSDTALAGKLLKQANTSFYGRPHAVSTLSDAVLLLGLRRVKTLALGFALVDRGRSSAGGFDYTAFWRRSLFAAVGARAAATRMKGVDPEEAFLGGLLHGIGVLAMNQVMGADYAALVNQAEGDFGELLGLETEHLGFQHADVGGLLAERWDLPGQLIEAIHWAPAPGFAAESTRSLVLCVSTGCAAADVFGCAEPGLAVIRYRDRCQQFLQMSVEESDQLLARVQSEAATLRPILDLPDVEEMSIADILSEAIAVLEALSLEADSENSRLAKENGALAVEASTDPLTGLANRRQLMEFMETASREAARKREPLSYIMVDVDHFKHVNDSHGHITGDRVLQEIAAVLRTSCRETDLVGRTGGDEFGVVATATNLSDAVRLAQRLRAAIDALALPLEGNVAVKVTLSIGVAVLDPTWASPIDELMGNADLALYEAKRSGRNAVRIAKRASSAA